MNTQFKKQYTLNDNFFSEYTKQSCYLAGLLAADGHIVNDRVVSITASEKDFNYLTTVKNSIDYTGPLWGPNKVILNGKIFYNYTLGVTSKQWVTDLDNNFSVTKNKTLTLKAPRIKDNRELFLSYLAGYIDGDGSIGSYKNNKGFEFAKIAICGTKELLDWIKEKLSIFGFSIKYKVAKIKDKQCYQLHINGSIAVELYKEIKQLDLSLNPRKWNNLDIYLIDYSPQKEKYKTLINETKILIENGLTITEIAGKINIPFQTIYRWKKKGLLC